MPWTSTVNGHGSSHNKKASNVPTQGPVLSLQGKKCRCTEIRCTKWPWPQAIWKRPSEPVLISHSIFGCKGEMSFYAG